jgi:hypothetical protein
MTPKLGSLLLLLGSEYVSVPGILPPQDTKQKDDGAVFLEREQKHSLSCQRPDVHNDFLSESPICHISKPFPRAHPGKRDTSKAFSCKELAPTGPTTRKAARPITGPSRVKMPKEAEIKHKDS